MSSDDDALGRDAPPDALRPRLITELSASPLALIVLVALPVGLFVGAFVIGGHLLLAGDNLIQNYPLRELVGTQIRHAILPAWDPYAFGGTPLLAGLNAGAFFPTTLLFALVSARAAWVVGDVLVYVSIGLGTYLLFRAGGARRYACLLGASTFTFAGAVASQTSVHIDMGDGIACLPWALFALRRIVDDGRWRWSIVLGASLACAVLSGSPEALLGLLVASVTYAVCRWSVTAGSGRRLISRSLSAVAVAAGSTAFAWIPALRFISVSQRAGVSEANASGYSFPPRELVLAVIPFLEGGYRLFSQGGYFGRSNLTEVTLYVGILPVVAVLALASRRWGAWLPIGERRCWYVVLVVAAVLAVAAGTPLEHVLYHVPFYGSQRDSGRFVIVVDLAASALFTWWLDGGSRPGHARGERVAALAPFVLVAVVGAFFAASPGTLWRLLGARTPAARPPGTTDELVLAAALTFLAGLVALLRPRLARVQWMRLLTAVALADLVLFSCGSAYLSSEALPVPVPRASAASVVAANLGPGGRYVVFDPGQFDMAQLASALEPDLGVLDQLPALSGYGSLVDGRYAASTGTTARDYLAPSGIAAGRFQPLGLQVLVTVPESFLAPIARLSPGASPIAVTEPPGTDPGLPGGNEVLPLLPPVPRTSPPRAAVGRGTAASWWFGTSLRVSTLLVTFPALASSAVVRAGTVDAAGSIDWGPGESIDRGSSDALFRLARTEADGVAIEEQRGAQRFGPLELALKAGTRTYLLNGALANTVVPSTWRVAGIAGDFTIYRSRQTPRTAWLELPTGRRTPQGVRVVARGPSSLTLAVNAQRAGRLVVATAYDSGWHAEIYRDGTSRPAAVVRDGLVQSLEVPAGSSQVRLSYEPPGFALGAAVSLASAGAFIVVLVAARRRSRTRPVP